MGAILSRNLSAKANGELDCGPSEQIRRGLFQHQHQQMTDVSEYDFIAL
jgi:hypothetical protein